MLENKPRSYILGIKGIVVFLLSSTFPESVQKMSMLKLINIPTACGKTETLKISETLLCVSGYKRVEKGIIFFFSTFHPMSMLTI
jgi:hypothetical protein